MNPNIAIVIPNERPKPGITLFFLSFLLFHSVVSPSLNYFFSYILSNTPPSLKCLLIFNSY